MKTLRACNHGSISTHRHTDRQTDKQTDRQTNRQTDRHTHTCTYKSNLYKPGVGQGMHTLIQNNSNLKVDIIQVTGPIAFTQSHTRTASSWSLQPLRQLPTTPLTI